MCVCGKFLLKICNKVKALFSCASASKKVFLYMKLYIAKQSKITSSCIMMRYILTSELYLAIGMFIHKVWVECLFSNFFKYTHRGRLTCDVYFKCLNFAIISLAIKI